MKEILLKSLKLSGSSRGEVLLIQPILKLLESCEEQIFRPDFPQTFPQQTFGHSYLLQKMQTKMKTQGSGKISPKPNDCTCT
jgi:hypothetical protein